MRRPASPSIVDGARQPGGPVTELATNLLSYGDNLDILRRYLPAATDAQLLAFQDTCHD